MVGQTSSPDFLTNTKAPNTSAQPTLQSDNQDNAFYVTLPTALTSLGYGTFLGGFDYERANAIAVDSNGFAYVTGVSTSWTDAVRTPPMHQAFPIQPPQPCAGGNTAACIPVQNPPKPPTTIYPSLVACTPSSRHSIPPPRIPPRLRRCSIPCLWAATSVRLKATSERLSR